MSKATVEELLDVAKAEAQSKGCTCDVQVRLPNREERREFDRQYGPRLTHVLVRHDDWCPLLQRIEGPGLN